MTPVGAALGHPCHSTHASIWRLCVCVCVQLCIPGVSVYTAHVRVHVRVWENMLFKTQQLSKNKPPEFSVRCCCARRDENSLTFVFLAKRRVYIARRTRTRTQDVLTLPRKEDGPRGSRPRESALRRSLQAGPLEMKTAASGGCARNLGANVHSAGMCKQLLGSLQVISHGGHGARLSLFTEEQ